MSFIFRLSLCFFGDLVLSRFMRILCSYSICPRLIGIFSIWFMGLSILEKL